MNTKNRLRETQHYIVSKWMNGGVRISAKDKDSVPRSGVVDKSAWLILKSMTDSEFDGSVVLEIGIGCNRKAQR